MTRSSIVALALGLWATACGGSSSEPPPPPPVPAWTPVGVAGVSAGGASELSFDADAAGALYLAYVDAANGSRATVMKYDGAAWTPVGAPGVSAGAARSPSLAVHGGVPYLGFIAGGTNAAVVLRFDPSGWTTVGTAGFAQAASQLALASDGTGLYAVALGAPGGWARVTGYAFDPSDWTTLAGFEGVGNLPWSDKPVTAHATGGKLYFAHYDYFGGNYQTVMVQAYDLAGHAVTTVGSLDVNQYVRPPIASSGGVVYWALVDGGNLSFQYPKPTVYRLTPGNAAAALAGSPADGYVGPVALAADASGVYAAFTDTTVSGKLVVKRYAGGTWSLVGVKGFSPDTASFLHLLSVRGVPHVAFQDAASGKATVMRFR